MSKTGLFVMLMLAASSVVSPLRAQTEPSLTSKPAPVKAKPSPTAATPGQQPSTVKPPAPGSTPPGGVQKTKVESDTPGVPLDVVAEFAGLQCTGVAVSKAGRMFVCFPRWNAQFEHSLVEVAADGTSKPYPNEVWNGFVEGDTVRRGIQFVCVQSVAVDDQDRLWVLDSAAPRMEGIARSEFDGGGPKLVEFDLATNTMRRVFQLGAGATVKGSYLNDFQLDAAQNLAYISDSGAGGMVVLNLRTRLAKRLLDAHPSTMADPAFVPKIGGRELRGLDGKVPQIHMDGIALDRANGFLYYQPLTGKRLSRIRTQALADALPGKNVTADQKKALEAAVESVAETVMTDGMTFDSAGNLYFTALEQNAIMVRTPAGEMKKLVSSPSISWPDSFAIAPARPARPDGASDPSLQLYFTTSQIHLTSRFSADGAMPSEPYRVLRTKLFTK